jgi:hypothetical protein
MGFFSSAKLASFNEQSLYPPRTLNLQEPLLWKLSQYSQQNNALCTTSSNTGGYLLIDICISSIQLNRPIWIKTIFSPTRKLWFSGSIPFQHYFHSHRETMGYILHLVTCVVSL